MDERELNQSGFSLNYQTGKLIKQTHSQGMVDGSASKPALRQDTHVIFHLVTKTLFLLKNAPKTDYMVEKSYNLSRYLGPFGAYFMPQGPK